MYLLQSAPMMSIIYNKYALHLICQVAAACIRFSSNLIKSERNEKKCTIFNKYMRFEQVRMKRFEITVNALRREINGNESVFVHNMQWLNKDKNSQTIFCGYYLIILLHHVLLLRFTRWCPHRHNDRKYALIWRKINHIGYGNTFLMTKTKCYDVL